MQSEQINELAGALAKAQGAMENAAKNKANPHFKSRYADLAAVLDAIRAPLSSNGLSTVQTMEIAERCIILRTTLLHSSGQFIATEYPIAMALKAQEMGAAITYGRRYSLAAIVGVAQDDDDANSVAAAEPAVQAAAVARINEKQLAELRGLIDQKDTSVEAVCKHLKVPSLADIPAERFQTILTAVKGKPDRKYDEAAE